MYSEYLSLLITVSLLINRGAAAAHSKIQSRSSSSVYVAGPKIKTDFPDPCVIQAEKKWYSFATATFAKRHTINIQVAESSDFINWHLVTNSDATNYNALPTPGAWVNPKAPNTWAPDVNKLDNGSYIMYYSGESIRDSKKHCIGAAISPTILGPYTALDTPLACPLTRGGAIDVSGFQDPDTAQRYILYKVDGNSIGHGGVCFNTVAPIVPTPILLQAVGDDGVSLHGKAVQLLDNAGVSDGGIVEAPSLVRSAAGLYVLFFSRGCYSTPKYTVGYAVSSKGIGGPYIRMGPLLTTGKHGLYAPGGADVHYDGKIVFHADLGTSASVRQMYTGQVKILQNGTVIM